jgi:hypothetical protein
VQHEVVLEHVNRSGHAEQCQQQKTGDENQNLALGESALVRIPDLSQDIAACLKMPTASQEAANQCSLALSVCSPPMAMMPPTIVVAAVPTIVTAVVPTVVVTATAVMAPPMPVSVPVTAFDLNDCPIGIAQRIGCRRGHSRCRHDWCKCKSTAGKSDYQKPLHLSPSSFVVSGSADYQVCFCNAG